MRLVCTVGTCLTCSAISVPMTMRNDSALSAKAAFMACGSLYPPLMKTARVAAKSSGPRTRARLNWIELSATAFGRSFLSTSWGSSVWYAGPPNDCARPVTNDSARMCQIWTTCRYISTASVPEVAIWMYCDAISVLRLS